MIRTTEASGHADAGNDSDDYEEVNSTTVPVVQNLTAQAQRKVRLMEINKPATKLRKSRYIQDKAAKHKEKKTNPKSTLSCKVP